MEGWTHAHRKREKSQARVLGDRTETEMMAEKHRGVFE